MRLAILYCLLAIFLDNISAQSDFRPGYIITNSLDTVHGLVDYRSEIRNMKICAFKKAEGDSIHDFLPGEIYGYRFNSGKFFVSKKIQTKEFNDTVFVEFLLKGISNLYYYSSLSYSAYFIESKDGELMELKSRDVRFEKDGVEYDQKDNKYVGYLIYAFVDCPEMRKDIIRADLSHKSLIQLTRKYHDYKCGDDACVVYEKELPVLKIELKPTVGYAFTGLTFSDSELESVDFRVSSSPFIGLGLNFIVPRLNEKMSILINVAFNKDYFYGSTFQPNLYSYYHIHNSNLITSFSIKYTYPLGRFRPELFAGFFGNSIVKSNTDFYTEGIRNNIVFSTKDSPDIFRRFNGGLIAGLGVEYVLFGKRRAFSNFSYLFGRNTQNSEINTTFSSFRLATGITF